ncbi:MAG: choice-of-anchor B family protein [Bacteroidetes bacterium]|nr:choice-of-anchor B family protein [Bacteroidota bacterium]
MKRYICLATLALFITHLAGAQQIPSMIGSRVQCTDNTAAGHACSNVDMLSRLSMQDMEIEYINDIWGWVDPDTKREYVLLGAFSSVVFVDVTDPINPIYLGQLPGHDSQVKTLWRDMKVYKNHMYVTVDGNGMNGVQVFDLSQLRSYSGIPINFQETAVYSAITTAHNIAINEETGFAYVVGYRLSHLGGGVADTCGGRGLHIVDIRDPVNPVYAGCFSDLFTGRGGSGYTHDVQCVIYRGPQIKYQGREICIGSNETHISIADVTDKENPVALAAADYPHVGYSHQGWLTEDHKYFLMNDEFDERHENPVTNTRTIIWDLSDLDDPIYHSSFSHSTTSIDHNLYVHGDYLYAANYTTGLRIVDISDIKKPREVAHFDTHLISDNKGFDGAWSSFRFPESGTTVVGSYPDGLFILDPMPGMITSTDGSAEIPESFSLSSAYPNPFNPTTSTVLALPEQAEVRAEALDLLGRSVNVIHHGVLPAGEHTLTFDAGNLPSGTYYIRVQTDRYVTGTKVILIK